MIFLYYSWTFQPGDWLRQSPILVISKYCDTTRQGYGANCEYNSDILSVHSQSEKREIQLSCTTLSPFFISDLSSSVYYDTDMISLIDLCLSLSTPHPPIMGLLPVIWWIANKYIYNYWQGTPILLVESNVILSYPYGRTKNNEALQHYNRKRIPADYR